jgi:antirestriction protein
MSEHQPIHATQQPDQREAEPQAVMPRVYAASLTDYNNGILHGRWLDAAVEADELQAGIAAMLAESPTMRRYGEPAEEWAFHDYEGFGSVRLGEFTSVETISRLAKGITEHGPAFAAWASHAGTEPKMLRLFDDMYRGEWPSVHDYAAYLIDELGVERRLDDLLDEWTRSLVKVDIDGFAHDLEHSGDIFTVEAPSGQLWIFDGH